MVITRRPRVMHRRRRTTWWAAVASLTQRTNLDYRTTNIGTLHHLERSTRRDGIGEVDHATAAAFHVAATGALLRLLLPRLHVDTDDIAEALECVVQVLHGDISRQAPHPHCCRTRTIVDWGGAHMRGRILVALLRRRHRH